MVADQQKIVDLKAQEAERMNIIKEKYPELAASMGLIVDEEEKAKKAKEKAKEIQKSMIDFGIVNGFMPEKLGGFNLDTLTFGMMMFEIVSKSHDIVIQLF